MRIAAAWLIAILAGAPSLSAAEAVDYVRDVKPILRQHCASCHGALRQKGGLRLDHAALIRRGGDSGPAVAATSGESLLIRAVRGAGDIERMPLDAKPLPDEQVATLAAWVDAGAIAPEEPLPEDPRAHWSYQKPTKLPLPNVQNSTWATHPIDRLLAIEHDWRGLSPAPVAAKNLLLRRVYLDLIGLPPSPGELAEFLADTSDNAYEKVVDRLLASPHYGERWGRHWMDVWRYSDWDGYAAEVRESQPHIWRWRDWIIESLNDDKPYDQMIVEMLAADEVAPLDPNALRRAGSWRAIGIGSIATCGWTPRSSTRPRPFWARRSTAPAATITCTIRFCRPTTTGSERSSSRTTCGPIACRARPTRRKTGWRAYSTPMPTSRRFCSPAATRPSRTRNIRSRRECRRH